MQESFCSQTLTPKKEEDGYPIQQSVTQQQQQQQQHSSWQIFFSMVFLLARLSSPTEVRDRL
jgi:hypothetical protein